MRERREPRVVIVGAGVAGITALHVFRERGFADVTVLEKGSDVGGVWYWNRYPGLTCDVPSQLYQFRFAPKPDWSRVWADGAEIQRYHRRVVDDLGLAGHIRTDTPPRNSASPGTYYRAIQRSDAELVTDAIAQVTPDGIRTADGTERPADVIVLATGFRAHDYMRPMEVVGRDGRTLEREWADGPRAYRMTAVPGFPNAFTVLGPNSALPR